MQCPICRFTIEDDAEECLNCGHAVHPSDQQEKQPELLYTVASKSSETRAPAWDGTAFSPSCPYCGAALKGRRVPKRRSAFKCAACGQEIVVDPEQYVYPTPYLTEQQAGYVYFLWQLDHWVFTKGSRQDYERMRAKLVEEFGGEPLVRDIVWGLFNENRKKLAGEYRREVMELRNLFDNDPARIPETRPYELEELEGLMEEFRDLESHFGKAT